jgi:hypothetical protein
MKPSYILLSAVLSISTVCGSALAGEVNFVPTGDSNAGVLKGEAPITMLGTIPLRNGTVILNDKVAVVKAAGDFSDTPRSVLAGSVLRTEANHADSTLTGIVVFLMGEWIRQIDDFSTPDVIFRNDGQIRGRIIGRDGDNLVLQSADGGKREIPLATMLYIRSPRVFVFNIKTKGAVAMEKDTPFNGSVLHATFRPTGSPRAISLSSVVPRPVEDDGLSPSNSSLSPAQLFEQDELPTATPANTRQKYVPNWLPQ